MIEKRFEQFKTVHEIAPVFLKNEGRIEALFTLYFLGLLVQALIERELRLAMKRDNIEHLRSIRSSAIVPTQPRSRSCVCSVSPRATNSSKTTKSCKPSTSSSRRCSARSSDCWPSRNTPSWRKMVPKTHSRLPLQPAESKAKSWKLKTKTD